jgi:4-diphosphocytidyl-2-C-methyl-D-erythritol kinase
LILFPNCKINLGLRILRKRPDGFHDLETLFYPIPIYDALEIVQTDGNEPVLFSLSGNAIEGLSEQNSCLKAYRLLNERYRLPQVKLHLHKEIPTGAGLGGGSADGAFSLLLLNKKFNLGLSEEQLAEYALQIGSDCPFFIMNRPAIGTGRGEQLKPISLDLSFFTIVIVNPGIQVNTGWAFSRIQPREHSSSFETIVSLPVQQWREELVNDFERPVFKEYPLLAEIKDHLYEQGAAYAAMSGSGATIFSLFPKGQHPYLSFP